MNNRSPRFVRANAGLTAIVYHLIRRVQGGDNRLPGREAGGFALPLCAVSLLFYLSP